MFNEINEIRLLYINESEMEKQLKRVIFLFISLIIPVLEIIILTLQIINIYDDNIRIDFYILLLAFCSLFSLFCTWGMMSTCYYNNKCIIVLLIIKTFFIMIFLLLCSNKPNFKYSLVFNIIGYGVFYTLIIVYKVFRKGIM